MLTDTERLKSIIKESGYKSYYIADFVGISYQALLNKINNLTDFRVCEIVRLCDLLKIDKKSRDEIFFTNNVANIGNK